MLKWLFRIIFKNELHEINKMKDEAQMMIDQAERAKNTSFTTINEKDVTSSDYKLALRRIIENECFQYEVMILKNDIMRELVSERANEKSAIQVMGMMKGIESLVSRIEIGSRNEYRKI